LIVVVLRFFYFNAILAKKIPFFVPKVSNPKECRELS
jgi:hypothetical protein